MFMAGRCTIDRFHAPKRTVIVYSSNRKLLCWKGWSSDVLERQEPVRTVAFIEVKAQQRSELKLK